jgi:hypothetical protein
MKLDLPLTLAKAEVIKGYSIKKFEAIFPNKSGETVIKEADIPTYVKVVSGPHEGFFKRRILAVSDTIYIRPNWLVDVPEEIVVQYEKCSMWDYYRFKLKHDRSERQALWAFFAAVLGVLLDLGFLIGKSSWHPIHLKEWQMIAVMILAAILKIGGLFLSIGKDCESLDLFSLTNGANSFGCFTIHYYQVRIFCRMISANLY